MGDEERAIVLLIGHDGNDAFKDTVEQIKRSTPPGSKVHYIVPEKDDVSGTDIARRINSIEGKKDVFILAHGTPHGEIEWNKASNISVGHIFAGVDSNVTNVFSSSCYGGMVAGFAYRLPNETGFYSYVSHNSVAYAAETKSKIYEQVINGDLKNLSPQALYLQSLDEIDFKDFAERNARLNAENQPNRLLVYAAKYIKPLESYLNSKYQPELHTTNPNEIIPAYITIPHIGTIDLESEVLSYPQGESLSAKGLYNSTSPLESVKKAFYDEGKEGNAQEQLLIEQVAQKIEMHAEITDPKEKAISYALMSESVRINGQAFSNVVKNQRDEYADESPKINVQYNQPIQTLSEPGKQNLGAEQRQKAADILNEMKGSNDIKLQESKEATMPAVPTAANKNFDKSVVNSMC